MSRVLIAASLIISMGAAARAVADDRFPPIANEAVRSECSDCHIAYQPEMLPQRSWRKMMGGLADHFDEELSLDEETRQQVLRYLLDNAADRSGTKGRGSSSAGFAPAIIRFGSLTRRAGRRSTTSCQRRSGRILDLR